MHVLARFGADGGDHAVEIGLELGVAELVAGQVEIGLGGGEPGLGGAQIAQRGVVGRLRRPAVLQELGLARLGTPCFDEHGLGRCDLRFGRAQAVLKVLRVERGQRVALSDRRADIDAAGEHLARDAERQIALVARLDLAYGLAIVVNGFGIDDNRADGPHVHRRLLMPCSRQEPREAREEWPKAAWANSPGMDSSNVDSDHLFT